MALQQTQQHDGDVALAGFQLAEVALGHIGLRRKHTPGDIAPLTQFAYPTAELLQKVGIVGLGGPDSSKPYGHLLHWVYVDGTGNPTPGFIWCTVIGSPSLGPGFIPTGALGGWAPICRHINGQ